MENKSLEDLLIHSDALLNITNDLVKKPENLSKSITKEEKNLHKLHSLGNFIQIPQGNFEMGSNDYSDESPAHIVRIYYDFAISKYLVTVKEYIEFANETNTNYPEWLTNRSNAKLITMSHYKNANLNDDAPIVGVSWENAKAYCKWKSQKEGKLYRLPTESEWEYCCRAGTHTRYSFGNDSNDLDRYAWYNQNANKMAHSVGSKKSNKWDIYDMHGNVWEWCEDVWNKNYDLAPRDGSANKVGNANVKVLRGGSWADSSRYVRSSNRNGYDIDGCDNDLGFRVVMVGHLRV